MRKSSKDKPVENMTAYIRHLNERQIIALTKIYNDYSGYKIAHPGMLPFVSKITMKHALFTYWLATATRPKFNLTIDGLDECEIHSIRNTLKE